MLGTKELYDREDLMKEADNIALSCIKDYDLSDYAENKLPNSTETVCRPLFISK